MGERESKLWELEGRLRQLAFEMEQIQRLLNEGYRGRGDVLGARPRVQARREEVEFLRVELRALCLTERAGLDWDTPLEVVADRLEELDNAGAAAFLRGDDWNVTWVRERRREAALKKLKREG